MTTNQGSALLRVLLVDDDALDRETVRRALRQFVPAPTVVEACDVREARQHLESAAFDCVVLDYLLPEGPCSEFMAGLKDHAPEAAFIVLTGQGDETIAVELMKAGALDYLSKDGLDASRLRRSIKYAVTLRRAEQQAANADARRRLYADQLRRFVERAPDLVSARSLEELADATANVALDILGAKTTFVSLRHAGMTHSAARGDDESSQGALAQWAQVQASGHKPELRRADTETRWSATLHSRDGEHRGVLAIQLAVPERHPTQEHMLGQLGLLVSICSDNLVLYDAASRAIRARDDVMAVVSHDLRTPLNNVRLGINLLRETSEPQVHSIIERVERNVMHMARLVDDLIDMVRLEGGQVELGMRDEPVDGLLAAATELIADQARAQQLHFKVTDSCAGTSVRADRDRILQVLSNLLGNAVKFTPQGGSIELSASDHGAHVQFEVRDTGRGIPTSEGDQVFLRFWQSDPKRRRGLGLGLYIAKGLIQAHGGKLWYESQEGLGTRFIFTLRKVASPAPTEMPT